MRRLDGRSSPQREKLLAIASTLFWKKGYRGTSLRDIAKAYGCKPANIYNFFMNKEELLFEFLSSQMKLLNSQIAHLEDDHSGKPVEQLRFLISKHLSHTLSYSKSSRLLFDVGLESLSSANRKKVIELRDFYNRILYKIIQRGIDSGEFEETDVKLAAYSIASIIIRTVIWYSPKGRLSIDEILDFIVNFASNALKGGKLANPVKGEKESEL